MGYQSNAKDVDINYTPQETGEQQRGILFYFCNPSLLLNTVHFAGCKIPTKSWEF